MSWEERLQQAAYEGPFGSRIEFDYEDVSYSGGNRNSAFDFIGLDGTYIQGGGNRGRRYPMRVIFWGEDYDLDAIDFEDVIGEAGIGKLDHPIYGTISVVPFGDFTRNDRLKSGGNQAVFNITFYETIGITLPSPQADPTAEVLSAVEESNEASAGQFADELEVGDVTAQVTAKNKYLATLDAAKAVLQPIADRVDSVRKQFNAVYDSINTGIDVLIRDPLTLANQTIALMHLPASALTGIADRLEAYGRVLDGIIGTDENGDPPVSGTQAATIAVNVFQIGTLFSSAAVTGSVLSTVFNEYENKNDAIESGDAVVSQSESLTAWQDQEREALEIVDTGETYQQRQEAVAISAGFLVEISFTLKPERRIVVAHPRTIIDLCSELYGTVDDTDIDRLINNNGLTGSEILEVPSGREILYYT